MKFVTIAVINIVTVATMTAAAMTTAFARETHESVLQYQIHSLDPLKAIDTNTQLIVNNSFDSLVGWSLTAGVFPILAEKWTVSPNGREYIFTLRTDFKFQNGDPLTPKDIINHFSRIRKSKSYFSSHFENISSTKLDRDNHIVFKLKQADSSFLALLSGVAGKIVKVGTDGEIIGVGPYIPKIAQDEVTLTADPNYAGVKPVIKKIHFRVAGETEAVDLAKSGAVDDLALFALEGNEVNTPQGQWLLQAMWATWIIGFDQRVSPFEKEEVRREFVFRLRSDDFVSKLFPNQKPAQGIIPIGVPGYVEPGTPEIYQEIISEAQPPPLKKDYHVEVVIPEELSNKEEIAKWITEKFQGSKVHVAPVFSSFDNMMKKYANGKMGSFLVSINAEYPDPAFIIRSLRSKSKSNFLGIKNKKLDQLIDMAIKGHDKMERQKWSQEVNRFLAAHRSSVNLMHVLHHVWMKNCVSDLQLSPISEGYFSYRKAQNQCQ